MPSSSGLSTNSVEIPQRGNLYSGSVTKKPHLNHEASDDLESSAIAELKTDAEEDFKPDTKPL